MEKNMETTILQYIGVIYGLYRNTGKETGNYYIVYWNFEMRFYYVRLLPYAWEFLHQHLFLSYCNTKVPAL